MNTDDPKFTAHALGELDDLTPAERAEIAALLAADADAAADAEETRALAARLRSELQSEQSAPLTDTQRAAVLAANAVPVSLRSSSDLEKASVRPWRPSRVLGSLALAASVVLCASLAWKAEFQKPVPPARELAAAPENPQPPQPAPDEPIAPHPEPEALAVKAPENPVAPDSPAVEKAEPEVAMATPVAAAPATNDVVAPGETLEVFVNEDPSFNGRYQVRRGGYIIMPQVGRIAVAGKTIPAAEAAIKRTLQSSQLHRASVLIERVQGADPSVEGLTAAASDLAPAPSSALAPMKVPQARPRPVDRLSNSALSGDIGSPVLSEEISRGVALSQGVAGAKPAEPPTERTAYKAAIPGTLASRGAAATSSLAKAKSDYYFDAPDAPAKGLQRGDALSLDGAASAKDVRKWTRGLSDEPQPDPAGGETAESYDFIADNAFLPVAQAPLSTFSIDVDTASYAIVRRFLNEQHLPPKGAVRIEELINYFTYDYPQPQGDAPFSATMEVTACPWTPAHRLVRIGVKGREIAKDQRPASNLVFLIDVSGSMEPANKLPLLKQSLGLLIDQLGAEDQVAMVVYAGNSGCVLEPTHSKAKMRAALKKLEAGGSTNGASGIQLAYEIAEKSFIKGGTNRVILATDGDWNVGVTNPADLFDMIAKKAKGGVFLTVLGVGMDNLKDSMLVKLADKGNGNYGYLDTLIEAKKLLADQLSGTLVTIAKDVKIQVEFNPAQVAAYRLIGYEKRLLAKEDFNDDTKDAGEIGAGHTVTALYEIVPAGGDVPEFAKIDDLKYQPRGAVRSEKAAEAEIRKLYESGEVVNRRVFGEPPSKEMLTLKLRYKAPDGDASKLLEFPLTDSGATWEKSSRDFRFAAAVAGYGMLLRDSPHKGSATWNSVRELAVEGKGEDATGYRAEFITLLEKAKALLR